MVFLYVIPVLPTIIKKNCIFELSELGYQSIIIDVTGLFAREYDEAIKLERINDKSFPAIKYLKPQSVSELEEYIVRYKSNSFFFPMFHNYYEVRKVYRLFTKYDVRYGIVGNLYADIFADKEEKSHNSLRTRLKYTHIRAAIYNRLLKYILRTKTAEFIGYVSNNLAWNVYLHQYPCDSATKILKLHTYDYELFLIDEIPDISPARYCVFLDQYLPYHPDLDSFDTLKIDAKKYYDEVNAFLEKIHNVTGLDMVVAAHPKADYRDKNVYHKNFRIIEGKTSELVKHASLVAVHFSTAISYAVMAEKPIVIIKNPELCNCMLEDYCDGYAELLNLKVLKELDDIDKNMFSVDKRRYDNYMNQYITCEKRDKYCLWSLITENIEIRS